MRLITIILFSAVLSGCSLFGAFHWLHPDKSELAQQSDRDECVEMSSIVYGSNEALLTFAKDPNPKPNLGLVADCLAAKGYKRVFISKQA